MRPLTMKQEKFVNGLIKGLSQREAYKKAYSTKNMKDATIDVKASELLKNGKVSVRFDEINGKVVKKAESKSIASAVEVMQFYSDLMRGEMKDVNINYDITGKLTEHKVSPAIKERVKAADALAKKYGLNELNVNLEANQTVIDVSKLSKEQIKEMLKDE